MKIINWSQIPAINIDRAVTFYAEIPRVSFHRIENQVGKHAFFAFDRLEILRTGGEILESAENKPSADGVLVYLNAPVGLDVVLACVVRAGGKFLMPKMSIGENGLIAIILDAEGNKIGLHSM